MDRMAGGLIEIEARGVVDGKAHACSLNPAGTGGDFLGQRADIAAHATQEFPQAHREHLVDARIAQPGMQLADQTIGLAARTVGLGQFAHAEIGHPQANDAPSAARRGAAS